MSLRSKGLSSEIFLTSLTTPTVSRLFPQEGIERRWRSLDGIDVPSDAIADT